MPLKGVGRMVEYEDSELTFLYEHTKTTTIYRPTISENYLKKRFSATKAIFFPPYWNRLAKALSPRALVPKEILQGPRMAWQVAVLCPPVVHCRCLQ